VIFLNTILVLVFSLYFVFTPLLIIGIWRVRNVLIFYFLQFSYKLTTNPFQSSPNWFIPYLIYDIIMINLSGCFFIVALIVWNLRTFWMFFIFFSIKLNSAVAVFTIYKDCGGVVDDTDHVSFTSGLSPTTTIESFCDEVLV
jgi:hypothetical protein